MISWENWDTSLFSDSFPSLYAYSYCDTLQLETILSALDIHLCYDTKYLELVWCLYKRQTAKKSCKYGYYRPFEYMLLLFMLKWSIDLPSLFCSWCIILFFFFLFFYHRLIFCIQWQFFVVSFCCPYCM